jgi:hypothetical protein
MEAEARRAAGDPAGGPATETVPAAKAGPVSNAAGTATPAAATLAAAGAVAAAVAGAGTGAATDRASDRATDRAAEPAAGATTGTAAPGDGTASAPEGTRWVHVSLLAGDLSLRADPDVNEVVVRGDTDSVRVEPSADGFTVRHVKDDGQDSWVDRFLSRIRSGHVEVRVPEGYGVDLAVTAGDVEIEGVPYLRGRLTSGDLDARGLRGIDFTTAAGDLDLQMTLTEGRHRLRATAGDFNVRLGAGSDVQVAGSVSIGSASVRAQGFDTDRRGVGQRFQGRVGEGKAQLDVHVTTGDVHVRVDE